MDDDPAKIALAMRIARRTKSIVYQNIVFALAIKAACLLLGALGIANMWAAIFADVGVMVLAVLNATRALYTKDLNQKIKDIRQRGSCASAQNPLCFIICPALQHRGRRFRHDGHVRAQ